MSKIRICFLIVLIAIGFNSCNNNSNNPTNTQKNSVLDKSQAQSAYTYLNNVRANPNAFSSEIGDDLIPSCVLTCNIKIWE
jgi:hypothetical protein